MQLYSQITEYIQYINPTLYKQRFFKKLRNLNPNNIMTRKVEPEFLWLQNIISKEAVFIDIGANVGAYLFVLEDYIKPENIYAFEPNKTLYKRLKRLFPKMRIQDLALSDSNMEADFKIPVIKGKNIHTRGTLQTGFYELDEEKTILQKVKVRKLDDLQLDVSRLDFMKIDVEGNEMLTLDGAKKTIQKFRPILMVEIEQRHHQEPIWDYIKYIESWGYTSNYLDRQEMKVVRLTEEFILLQNAKDIKNYKSYINNIIFLPNN